MTDLHSCSYYCDRPECIKAQRDELRERLAQPQMQPCAGRNCGSTNPNLHSAECFEDYEKSTGMAQPEQEPVAWLDGPHLVVRLDMRNRLNYQGPWVDLGRAIPDKWTPFLYTAPPQRKPLPPQSPCEMTQAEGKMFKLGWLECEAAHGIKENT
jgi:hypothetical protein